MKRCSNRLGTRKRHTPAVVRRCVVACCLTAFAAFSSACLGDDSPARPLRTLVVVDAETDVVSVVGLWKQEIELARKLKPSELGEVLQVAVSNGNGNAGSDGPLLLGKVNVESERITFRPRFAFREGITYSVVARLGMLGERDKEIAMSFARPKSVSSPPTVVAVFPSAHRLPENLLKFYLHFSQPMQQGDSYRYLQLVDLDSQMPVELPFLELGEELWDPTGQRLTVLFDPGRIKQGLKPREIAGPVLVAGRRYRLQISKKWQSASGHGLTAPFHKDFEATRADTIQPSAVKWKIDSPTPASRDPLTIAFAESLDHAMLERVISVEVDGHPVAGKIAIDSEETRWVFTPSRPWPSKIGTLQLRCDTTLEDNAGNSIGRAFEVRGGIATLPDASIVIRVPPDRDAE